MSVPAPRPGRSEVAHAQPRPRPVRASVFLSDRAYLVRPLDDRRGRAYQLIPTGPTARGLASFRVLEHDDPEEGCSLPALRGLSCSCGAITGPEASCSHLVDLVDLGLLRPAPGWPDGPDAVLDARYTLASLARG